MSRRDSRTRAVNRHDDWAVIDCLVGGGQEINTGETGIAEWLEVIRTAYAHWHLHLSSQLTESEYSASDAIAALTGRPGVQFDDDLHLDVSMRSFRSEHVSAFVKRVLIWKSTRRPRCTRTSPRTSPW